jgi:hypothetical protein
MTVQAEKEQCAGSTCADTADRRKRRTGNKTLPIRPFLLTREQAAAAIGISRRVFEEVRPTLIARGMKEVRCGRRINVITTSLEQVVTKAAEDEKALF